MREIKFRCFHNDYGMFEDPDLINLNDGSIKYDSDWYDSKEIKLMQYTGLKDRNGVEIFEGDICECNNGLENYWYVVEWIFSGWQIVTYKKPTAKVRGISDGINQAYLEPDYAAELTIVGNIHENADLMEVQKND